MDFIPNYHELLRWLLAAVIAAGVLGSISAAAAAVVMRIPIIGPVLAAIIPPIMAQYEKWLADRLQEAADEAVKTVEQASSTYDLMPKRARSIAKQQRAMALLNEKLPEARRLKREAIVRHIEDAVSRMKGN